MEIHVRTVGLEGLKARLRAIEQDAREAVAEALNATADYGQALIKQATPVGETGAARESIEVDHATAADLNAAVFTRNPVNTYLEYGTGIHSDHPRARKRPILIRARYKRALAFTWQGAHYIRKSVVVMGMHPFAPFRTSYPLIRERFVAELRERLRDLGRR